MPIHVKVRGDVMPRYRCKIPLTLLRRRFKIFPSPLHDLHMFRFMIIFALCFTIGEMPTWGMFTKCKAWSSMFTPPNSEGKKMSTLKCMFSHLVSYMQILCPKISCHHFWLELIPLLVDTYNDIRVFFFSFFLQIPQVGPLVKILNTK
jgi:hypothetical protein